MAANLLSCNYEDEEFIDMEVSSSLCSNSLSKSREFEFQMTTNSIAHSNSPADELFYKGRLLPLHLPPRVQMVKSLLQNATYKEDEEFITFSTPMVQSCNISPTESCRASTELGPDEYFFEWSTGFIADHPKKYHGPWSKKLKLIKKCSITQKLKLQDLFSNLCLTNLVVILMDTHVLNKKLNKTVIKISSRST
ncbi:putative BKI1/putative membrane-associated kinase regulator/4 [Helianthus annuus]|nr:putative BKI1/putative membrane-associated kinase regulator/4 [Helianthus annuus]